MENDGRPSFFKWENEQLLHAFNDMMEDYWYILRHAEKGMPQLDSREMELFIKKWHDTNNKYGNYRGY